MRHRLRENIYRLGKIVVKPVNVTALVSFVLIFCFGYFVVNARYMVFRTSKVLVFGDSVDEEEKAPLDERNAHKEGVSGKNDNGQSGKKGPHSNRNIRLESFKSLEAREEEWEIFNSSNLFPSPLDLWPASRNSSVNNQRYLSGEELNSLKIQQKLDEIYPGTKEMKTSAISPKHGVLYSESVTTKFFQQPISRNWRNLPNKLYQLAPFIFDSVPKQFLPEFKNPCWYSPDKQFRCLPYFYLLGFPKCGTTDLWYKMGNHPKIAETHEKETHYWAGFTFGSPLSAFYDYLSNGISIGHRLLSGETDAVYGDGSPTTVYMHWRFTEEDQNVTEDMYTKVDIIKELTPKAKMIIMLREPAERFYSGYLFSFAMGGHSTHGFHEEASQSVAVFQKCLQRESELNCLCERGPNIFRSKRLMTSMYLPFIKAWVDGFGFDQIMFIRLEDWKVNCTSILPKVYEFLELDALQREVIRDVCRTKPKNVNRRHLSLGEMLPKTKQMLEEFFAPYNEELAKYLNISVYHATPQEKNEN